MIKKIARSIWDNFEDYVSAIAIVTMVVVLFCQVFTRYVLGGSITWAEELSRFSFLWFMFLSSSIAAKNRSHIRVTAPLLLLPKPYRRWVIFFSDMLWVAFNIVMVVLSWQIVEKAMKFTNLSPSLKINMVWMLIVIPISFLLMSVRIIGGYVDEYRGIQEPYDI